MNVSKPPFDNPKVREAVNYAINRQEIVDAALFGAGVPGGPLSPALKSWALDVKQFACYKPDPAKAQALLKEAGVATPVAVTMNVLPRQDIKDIAQVVQEQLNKAGFKVELNNQEQGQFIQDWRNSNFDLFASTQCRPARSGRLFLPHLPHGRLDQRVQVFGRGDRRAARPGPHHAGPGCAQGRLRQGAAEARLLGPGRAPRPTAPCSRPCAASCRATT